MKKIIVLIFVILMCFSGKSFCQDMNTRQQVIKKNLEEAERKIWLTKYIEAGPIEPARQPQQRKEGRNYYEKRQKAVEESLNQAEIGVKIYGGGISYKESVSVIPVESDWMAGYSKVLLDTNVYLGEYFELGANFGILASLKSEEDWKLGGSAYQTNDMSLWGLETAGYLGYALNRDSNLVFTPTVGMGFKRIDFKRRNFNFFGVSYPQIGEVKEKFYISHADLGLKFAWKLSNKWFLDGKTGYSFVFWNEADNEIFGKIKGDGGYIVPVELGLGYKLSDSIDLGFGGFWEYQKLKGATENGIEWPDNKLTSFGGTLKGTYKF